MEKNLLKTVDGKDIPIGTRGILLLCALDYDKKKIEVIQELLYDNEFDALNAYANIHNPESQLVRGETFQELMEKKMKRLQEMQDPKWVQSLINCI